MKKDMNDLVCVVVIAVIINLVVPLVVKSMASAEQVKPTNGAENLSLVDQVVHMLVHHAQVPLSSSIVVAVIVAVSVYLCRCCKM